MEAVPTENEFDSKINNSNLNVVGFFSPKCSCCNMLLPLFEAQSKNYPTIQFLKVRPSVLPSVFRRYSIVRNGASNLPQVVLLRNGVKVAVADNIYNETALNNFIKSNLSK